MLFEYRDGAKIVRHNTTKDYLDKIENEKKLEGKEERVEKEEEERKQSRLW